MTPMESVTPKPLTEPDAKMKSSNAASRVVTLESMMAVQALLKPTWSARLIPALGFSAYSSRARSKTSTFARSEEHTSELQSLMRISYAVFCLKKKKDHKQQIRIKTDYHTITKKVPKYYNN